MGLFDLFKKQKLAHRDLEICYELSDSNSDELKEIEIGNIHLPTGKIIASDPFFTHSIKSFSRTVHPGTYPVSIYIAEVEPEHYRVAFAKIKFRAEKATRWILAVTDDMKIDDLSSIRDGEYFGFPVDAGLACFLDEESNVWYLNKMDEFYEKNPDQNYYDDLLAQEFEKYSASHQYSRDLGDWNNHVLNGESEMNVMMFASGWGDGYYPTYWGYNDRKETVELCIDFLIDLDEEE
ncbi:DUF4241 domain-containing protein [Marinifilum flexuosum]|uniref:DUF4241 domain-containing protein n=1 Tax=Marinifilum flexuosum TaxID=1117708 RepID=UPI0024906307|nr:DUF4241 domain-containing protein [Marinifilum flexuosum]